MPDSIVSFDTIQRCAREAAAARARCSGEARAALVRRQSEADTALERCQAEATAAAQFRPSDAAPAFSRRLTGLLVNECLRAVEGSNG